MSSFGLLIRINPYGHAALQTAKYHISFWSDGDVKDSELGASLIRVPASLVFHPELDRFYEGIRLPTGRYEIVGATDEAINLVYEEFLHYNGIDPEDVTLQASEQLIEKSEKPEVSLPETKYNAVQVVVHTLPNTLKDSSSTPELITA